MGSGYFRRQRPQGRATPCQRAICALLALLALLAPAQAAAQMDTDSQIVPAAAAILDTGTMVALAEMDFGKIAQPSVAGTVTMSAGVAPTCNVTAGIVKTGACQPATFAIMGRKNWLVRIRQMNGGTITLDGPGAATMTVTNLTLGVSDMVAAPGGPSPPGTFGRYQITSDSGMAQFRIGGRLNVAAGQAAGIYTGTLTIQVNFN